MRSDDTQFFIDNAYFQTFDCSTPAGATPDFVCYGMGSPPDEPGIDFGAWQSEGGVLTRAQYTR